MLVLPEGDLRLNAEDAAFGGHEKGLHVPAVLVL